MPQPSMHPLNPVLTALAGPAAGGVVLEALRARNSSQGILATVRATEGVGGPELRAPEPLELGDPVSRGAFATAVLEAVDPLTGGSPSATDLGAALSELYRLVEVALRGPTAGAGIAGAPAGPGPAGAAGPSHPYAVQGRRLVYQKPITGGVSAVVLTNFTAAITHEHVIDDGANPPVTEFEVSGELDTGRPLPTVCVPARRFAGMDWVGEHWGAEAVVSAGIGSRDHARAAIQLLSCDGAPPPRRTTYAHSGFRNLAPGGRAARHVYLHGAGGIGAGGALPPGSVDVRLAGNLAQLVLPDPPPADGPAGALADAVRLALALFDGRLAPDRVLVALLGAAYRAPLASTKPVDTTPWYSGDTGNFKTELTVLGMQHYGAGFRRNRLPAEWSGTANSLERITFDARDALCVIDDYAPASTVLDTMKLQAAAARIIRNVGNTSARTRLQADTTARPTYFPRCALVSSGEDLPAGGTRSVLARLLVVEVGAGDVDPERLAVAQARGRDGVYATAMAGYVRWLAGRLDAGVEQELLEDEFLALREQASTEERHRRTAETVANLFLGWRRFLAFARDIEAITGDEHDALAARAWAALEEVAAAQQGDQRAQDPVERFRDALLTALASGQAHVAGPDGDSPRPPADPRAWGWRRQLVGGGEFLREEWRAQGVRIGWVDGAALYLDTGAAVAVAEQQLHRLHQTLGVGAITLKKRLHERGLLTRIEQDDTQRHLEAHVTVAGGSRRALHLRADWLDPAPHQAGLPSPPPAAGPAATGSSAQQEPSPGGKQGKEGNQGSGGAHEGKLQGQTPPAAGPVSLKSFPEIPAPAENREAEQGKNGATSRGEAPPGPPEFPGFPGFPEPLPTTTPAAQNTPADAPPPLAVGDPVYPTSAEGVIVGALARTLHLVRSDVAGREGWYARTSDPDTTTGYPVGQLLPLATAVAQGLVDRDEALRALGLLPPPLDAAWAPDAVLAALLDAPAPPVGRVRRTL